MTILFVISLALTSIPAYALRQTGLEEGNPEVKKELAASLSSATSRVIIKEGMTIRDPKQGMPGIYLVQKVEDLPDRKDQRITLLKLKERKDEAFVSPFPMFLSHVDSHARIDEEWVFLPLGELRGSSSAQARLSTAITVKVTYVTDARGSLANRVVVGTSAQMVTPKPSWKGKIVQTIRVKDFSGRVLFDRPWVFVSRIEIIPGNKELAGLEENISVEVAKKLVMSMADRIQVTAVRWISKNDTPNELTGFNLTKENIEKAARQVQIGGWLRVNIEGTDARLLQPKPVRRSAGPSTGLGAGLEEARKLQEALSTYLDALRSHNADFYEMRILDEHEATSAPDGIKAADKEQKTRQALDRSEAALQAEIRGQFAAKEAALSWAEQVDIAVGPINISNPTSDEFRERLRRIVNAAFAQSAPVTGLEEKRLERLVILGRFTERDTMELWAKTVRRLREDIQVTVQIIEPSQRYFSGTGETFEYNRGEVARPLEEADAFLLTDNFLRTLDKAYAPDDLPLGRLKRGELPYEVPNFPHGEDTLVDVIDGTLRSLESKVRTANVPPAAGGSTGLTTGLEEGHSKFEAALRTYLRELYHHQRSPWTLADDGLHDGINPIDRVLGAESVLRQTIRGAFATREAARQWVNESLGRTVLFGKDSPELRGPEFRDILEIVDEAFLQEDQVQVLTLEELDRVDPGLAQRARASGHSGVALLPVKAMDVLMERLSVVHFFAHPDVTGTADSIIPSGVLRIISHNIPVGKPEERDALIQQATQLHQKGSKVLIALDASVKENIPLPQGHPTTFLFNPRQILLTQDARILFRYLAQDNLILDLTSGSPEQVTIEGRDFFALFV